MKKLPIADNADYLASQISFLKEGTELIDPSACPGRVLLCYLCQQPIPCSCLRTSYYLVCGKARRICEICYKNYKQTFDIRSCRKSSKKKGGR